MAKKWINDPCVMYEGHALKTRIGDEWLTREEIAQRAGITATAVFNRMRRGLRGADLLAPAPDRYNKPHEQRLTEQEREELERYAANDMSMSAAARELHYTKGGLYYHFKRIQTKTGLDPLKFYDLVALLRMAKEGTT